MSLDEATTPKPPGRWGRVQAWASPEALLSIATVGLSLLGLVGLEYFLRLARPDYLHRPEGGTTVYSEIYGWTLRDGFRGLDNDAWTTINPKGYRGREHAYRKTPGRTRVLMLGDSITYGPGVEDDQIFSALVEARNPQLEVVNLAVGGYGTDQELIQLEREGLRYAPDVIVLNFCLFSDFADNALAYGLFDAHQPKPYFTWEGRALTLHDDHLKLSVIRRLAQSLADRSHLYNRLRVLLGTEERPRKKGAWVRRMDTALSNIPAATELTFRLVRRISDLSRQAGARFLVLVHPDEDTFRQGSRSQLMDSFCATPLLEGITVVEMGALYRGYGLQWERIAEDPPGHLTPLGHQAAADVITTLLSQPVPGAWDYRRTCRAGPPS